MTQPFDDLIAELDAAKADVARSVRKSRAFIADRGAGGGEPPQPVVKTGLADQSPPEK